MRIMTNYIIEKAKSLGMQRHEYDDGFYYVIHYSISPYEIKRVWDENGAVTLEFQEDLSYAQIVKPNYLFRELTIEECLGLVEGFNEIAKYLC